MTLSIRNFSIRSFLLINILLITALVASLSALGDYYLNQADVQTNMDMVLEQMGLSFHAVLASTTEPATRESLHDKFFSNTQYDFQVWTDKNTLQLFHLKQNYSTLILPPQA
jgi:hypothetical protein